MQSAWAVGYLLAALLAALVLPRWGWRPLFVAGVLPALATLWIRRNIPEPAKWTEPSHGLGGALATLFRPPLVRHVALFTAMCSCVLFGYWGMFTWLPAYLGSPVRRGGQVECDPLLGMDRAATDWCVFRVFFVWLCRMGRVAWKTLSLSC